MFKLVLTLQVQAIIKPDTHVYFKSSSSGVTVQNLLMADKISLEVIGSGIELPSDEKATNSSYEFPADFVIPMAFKYKYDYRKWPLESEMT